MLMRPFSRRERVLLLLLALVLTAAVYLLAVDVPVRSEVSALDIQREQLEAELVTARVKAELYGQMKAELEELLSSDASADVMPTYDNLQPLMTRLNQIFALADSYKLTFSPLETEEGVVRRKMNMSFTCADYPSVKALLAQFGQTGWRFLMNDLTLSAAGQDGDLMHGSVTASASVTFFELMP